MGDDIKKGLLGIVVDETEVSKVMPEINSLTYRGYAAQDLCEYCRFEEVAYLILNKDLPNSIQLRSKYAYRILKAKWATIENLEYSAVLRINGFDQIGLVNKITKLISNEMNVNISSINIESNNGIFDGRISVIVINKVHLDNLINKLESIEGVESVERL